MKGIVVGCGKEKEWLLMWWWKHYHKYNRYPVVFIDFGMTQEARKWCSQRGTVLDFERSDFVSPKTLINQNLINEWENTQGSICWNSRKQLFLKPFAMLQTPFTFSVWIDLECEITGSLAPLFHKIHPHTGIAVSCEGDFISEDVKYNTGVVAFIKDSFLIEKWACACLRYNDRFFSDQDVLEFLIQAESLEITELAGRYNWRLNAGINIDAVVINWQGLWGREILSRLTNQK